MNMKKMILTIAIVLGIFMTAGVASAAHPGETVTLMVPANGTDFGCPDQGVGFCEQTAQNVALVKCFVKTVDNETDFVFFVFDVVSEGPIHAEVGYINPETNEFTMFNEAYSFN